MENTAAGQQPNGQAPNEQKPWFLRTWFIVLVSILVGLVILVSSVTSFIWHGYQHLQSTDIDWKASTAEVMNQYQRRNDLLPKLLKIVEGEAIFEKSTFIGIAEARAKATSVQLTADALNNPNAMAQYQKYQGDISNMMSKLMVASENYPELKSNHAFRELRDEWTGSENRCGVARNRQIQQTAVTNKIINTNFPEVAIAKFINMSEKPQFGVGKEEELGKAPDADMSNLVGKK